MSQQSGVFVSASVVCETEEQAVRAMEKLSRVALGLAFESTPRPTRSTTRTMMTDLDPRWDWVEERVLCQAGPSYVRGQCNHLEVVPVESVLDEDVVVAHLCVTCDQQLPAEWQPGDFVVPPPPRYDPLPDPVIATREGW